MCLTNCFLKATDITIHSSAVREDKINILAQPVSPLIKRYLLKYPNMPFLSHSRNFFFQQL